MPARRGGGWDQASPLLGPPQLRLGVLGRVPSCWVPRQSLRMDLATAQGQSLQLPGCFSSCKHERRQLGKRKQPHFTSLLGVKHRTRRTFVCQNLSAKQPGIAHLLLSSPAQGGIPPATTRHNISKPYGQKEMLPRGGKASSGRDWL